METLAVQLSQREGELLQEKSEVKKLAIFLKKVVLKYFVYDLMLVSFIILHLELYNIHRLNLHFWYVGFDNYII